MIWNILRTFFQRIKIAEDLQDKMRTVSKKIANSSKYYMDGIDFFSIETITVPIRLRLFAVEQLSLS